MSVNISSLKDQVRQAYEGEFMQPEVKSAKCLVIDGDYGQHVFDLIDVNVSEEISELTSEPVMEEDMSDQLRNDLNEIYGQAALDGSDVYEASVMEGYMFRLSASGYMDCTDWSFAKTEEEALNNLLSMNE